MINQNQSLTKIVVFDSGLGSLSIIKEIQKEAEKKVKNEIRRAKKNFPKKKILVKFNYGKNKRHLCGGCFYTK